MTSEVIEKPKNSYFLSFVEEMLALENIGDTMFIPYDLGYTLGQVTRALYFHGTRNGKKFSQRKNSKGYFITLVDFR